MKISIKTFLLSILLFLTTVCLTGHASQVSAAENDYTPSITIIKESPSGTITDDGSQIYYPMPGVNFTIKRVDVIPSQKDGKIVLADPTTFIVNEYTGNQKVNLNLTTDSQGKIYVEGADVLPKGFYQIIENTEYGQTVTVVLPYLDKDGKVSDDIVLYPKEHNPGTPITPVPDKEKPDVPEKDITPPNKPSNNPGQPGNPIEKIMQTSGKIMTIPLVQLVLFMIGSFIVLVSLVYIFSKRRRKNN